MKAINMNWNPTDRQLRQFGLTALAALPTLAWLWRGGSMTILIAAAVGLGLAGTAVIWPRGIKPLFLGMSLLALPIGIVVHEVTMVVMFFGVFVPLGLVFRLIGRDPLAKRIDRNAASYWLPKKRPRDAASYFRQS